MRCNMGTTVVKLVFSKKLIKFKILHKKVQKLRKKGKLEKKTTQVAFFCLKPYVRNDIFERKTIQEKNSLF